MSIAINFDNHLLRALPVEDFELLRRHLRGTLLRKQTILFDAGDDVERAWFPNAGAVSLTMVLGNGQAVETAVIGRCGIVGSSAALAPQPSSCRAVVEIEASAASIDIGLLRQLATERQAILTLLVRHEASLLAQTQQVAACNAVHSLEARFGRWLLTAHAACGGCALAVTQERIAELLGVRRTSICLVAHAMQTAGLIRTRRGHIEILDETALRATACNCHVNIAAHAASQLRPPQPMEQARSA
jgi:CRP-like cAMP-binding protein